jgi:hypothetical protein
MIPQAPANVQYMYNQAQDPSQPHGMNILPQTRKAINTIVNNILVAARQNQQIDEFIYHYLKSNIAILLNEIEFVIINQFQDTPISDEQLRLRVTTFIEKLFNHLFMLRSRMSNIPSLEIVLNNIQGRQYNMYPPNQGVNLQQMHPGYAQPQPMYSNPVFVQPSNQYINQPQFGAPQLRPNQQYFPPQQPMPFGGQPMYPNPYIQQPMYGNPYGQVSYVPQTINLQQDQYAQQMMQQQYGMMPQNIPYQQPMQAPMNPYMNPMRQPYINPGKLGPSIPPPAPVMQQPVNNVSNFNNFNNPQGYVPQPNIPQPIVPTPGLNSYEQYQVQQPVQHNPSITNTQLTQHVHNQFEQRHIEPQKTESKTRILSQDEMAELNRRNAILEQQAVLAQQRIHDIQNASISDAHKFVSMGTPLSNLNNPNNPSNSVVTPVNNTPPIKSIPLQQEIDQTLEEYSKELNAARQELMLKNKQKDEHNRKIQEEQNFYGKELDDYTKRINNQKRIREQIHAIEDIDVRKQVTLENLRYVKLGETTPIEEEETFEPKHRNTELKLSTCEGYRSLLLGEDPSKYYELEKAQNKPDFHLHQPLLNEMEVTPLIDGQESSRMIMIKNSASWNNEVELYQAMDKFKFYQDAHNSHEEPPCVGDPLALVVDTNRLFTYDIDYDTFIETKTKLEKFLKDDVYKNYIDETPDIILDEDNPHANMHDKFIEDPVDVANKVYEILKSTSTDVTMFLVARIMSTFNELWDRRVSIDEDYDLPETWEGFKEAIHRIQHGICSKDISMITKGVYGEILALSVGRVIDSFRHIHICDPNVPEDLAHIVHAEDTHVNVMAKWTKYDYYAITDNDEKQLWMYQIKKFIVVKEPVRYIFYKFGERSSILPEIGSDIIELGKPQEMRPSDQSCFHVMIQQLNFRYEDKYFTDICFFQDNLIIKYAYQIYPDQHVSLKKLNNGVLI